MPQVFQVLKCYKCVVFQIHQTKKSNKFECIICGEKQSIKRHYGIGSGKDCRLHVQRLNSLRGEEVNTIQNDSEEENVDDIVEPILQNSNSSIVNHAKRSKWSAYLDKEGNTTDKEIEESMFLGDKEVLLELPPKKKPKKFKVKIKSSSYLDDEGESLNISTNSYRTKVKDNKQIFNINNNDVKSDNIVTSIYNSNENSYTLKNSNITESPQIQDKLNSSKWAHFVGTEKENDIINDNDPSSNHALDKRSKSHNLFSLCDEINIDSVLDI